ncbi:MULTISPECIES: GH92 family glycosyl hydrolase [unclassified Novosphingobium]|uniref:GH92 family glycosyl hydrolase n=1 Tax=unclassified Novosphingobium TaxID=2644732 RepID=UPI0018EE8F0B
MMKPTRRDMLKGSAGLAGTLAGGIAQKAAALSQAAPDAALALVDPMIGTGGHGHVTPAATVPFGMVQLGPDTDNARWDACSGYHHDDTTLLGFSHNHLSGTGVGDLMDVLVVPRTGPVVLSPGTRAKPQGSYRQRFDHADETVEPGYYAVHLRESGIGVELTATARVGLHRYHFAQAGHLLIDLAHGARDEPDEASIADDPSGPTKVTEASLHLAAPDLITGSRRVHQWADGRQIHFALRLSRPAAQVRLFSNDAPLPEGATQVAGANLKAAVMLPDAAAAPVLVKVGLSGVDVAGALAALDAEVPGWDFAAVRGAARAAWATRLGAVQVSGGTPDQRRIMATALYHAAAAPNLFCDVDGRYRAMDSAVRTLPAGEANYSTYSLWDTYRALHPLLSLVDAPRNAAFARNLARMTLESPFGPPVWPLQGIETHCMIAWHSVAVMADALNKGASGLDLATLWPALRHLAFEREDSGLEPYRRLGYIPADTVREAASKTLEYAYDDWAMAAIAAAAGAHEDATALRARSRNWRNLFDKDTGFVRPRLANGAWATPFDPRALGHDTNHWRDFTECNAWQATFMAQHDPQGLIDLMGGDAAFEAELDALFAADSTLPADAPPDVSGLVGQYAHGNEPSHHVAYLYAWSGSPWKTQARVRSLLTSMYRAAPDGLAGNEDCGQMSAWFVLSALGIYPVDPVSGVWVFGSPLFNRAELAVPGGRLVIEAPGNSAAAVYVRQVRWNGQVWNRSWISHAELARGGHLVFEMDTRPNPAFGHAPETRPPRNALG